MKYEYPEDGTGKIMVHQGFYKLKIFRDILNFALLTLLCVVLIYLITHDAKAVSGESMQPTINSEFSEENQTQYDIVLVNKTQKISRGDIIIINASQYNLLSGGDLIIKRVIAIEGDTINIGWDDAQQKLIVSLKKAGSDETEILVENYIKKDINDPTKDDPEARGCSTTFENKDSTSSTGWWSSESYILNGDGSITIPEGYFFALGDNRGHSADSSELGPIPVNKIIGVVDTLVPNGSFLNNFLRVIFGIRLSA